jgi:hypothetical protein
MRRWRADGGRRVPTLGGLERTIVAAMKRRAERAVVATADSGADAGVWTRLKAAVEAAGAEREDEAERVVLRKAWAMLKRHEATGGDPWGVVPEVDAELMAGAAALLSDAERDERERAVTSIIARSGENMSERAMAERRALELVLWTRTRFRLPDLVGVLLG